MSKLSSAIVLSLLFFGRAYSQSTDTIKILQYNLLNYGSSDNIPAYKNPRLHTIIQYCDPDIFGANEISYGSVNSQNILDNVLGAAWEKGNYMNTNNSSQTNMLFWKKDKFGLAQQQSLANLTRDIIAFKLYYKDAALAQTHDTTFLTVIVGHLKAGSNDQDASDRNAEVAVMMDFLNTYGSASGNYIFMGDMNVYTSSESFYNRLMSSNNTLVRFYDPINRPGDWSANSSFADIHSQSTRRNSSSDGGATGGLDDRFDQMLISGSIKDNVSRVAYLEGSYHIVAQDGAHFNRALTDAPQNTLVPSDVLESLFQMSDHLPVTAKFLVRGSDGTAINDPQRGSPAAPFLVINPVRDHTLRIICREVGKPMRPVYISLYNEEGIKVLSCERNRLSGTIAIPVDVPQGMYFLRITGDDGLIWTTRLLIPAAPENE